MRELTNAQWTILQPLLPPRKRMGRPRADDRRTLNAILYVLLCPAHQTVALDTPASSAIVAIVTAL